VDADATLYTEIEPGDRIVLYTDGLTDVSIRVEEMLKVKDYRTSFAKRRSPVRRMKRSILDVSLLA